MRDKITVIEDPSPYRISNPSIVNDRSHKPKGVTVPREKIKECVVAKAVHPVNKTDEFKRSAQEILKAIQIDGVNIIDKMHDVNFHFNIESPAEFGATLSEAFTIILNRDHTIVSEKRALVTEKRVKKATEKRIEKADEYAVKMYEVIENMKFEAGVSSVRGTIKLLKKQEVETPEGGNNWHITTWQNLNKRWEKLGLKTSKVEPK